MQGDATIRCQDIVISLFHHTVKVVQSQVLAEHFVTNAISLQKPFKFLQESSAKHNEPLVAVKITQVSQVAYHNAGNVIALKAADCQFDALVHVRIDALCNQFVQVNGAS